MDLTNLLNTNCPAVLETETIELLSVEEVKAMT